ncbi:OsmC family protein [Flavobacterium sp. DGU11]|uniref:OsmC family protein n=1 Tax=Flavobacterium arundinis TaxID=3139143 RepID=A0ABU9HUK1_9FLAO
MKRHSYNISLQWEGERKGTLASPELPTSMMVATPPEFDKGIAGIWSPEHLFTGAIVSCYMTTFLAIAEHSKMEFKAFSCTAEGVLEKVDNKYLMTQINLKPVVTIASEEGRSKAERVMQKAEAACLISNSVKTEIIPHYTVLVQ